MKKFLVFLPFLASCGIFKKPIKESEAPVLFFESHQYPEIRKALAIDFTITRGSDELDYSLFPLSDSGFHCEYYFAGNQGEMNSSPAERSQASTYFLPLSVDAVKAENQAAGWLSQKNFNELQRLGKTRIAFNADSALTYVVKGESEYTVLLQDSGYVVKVVELVAVEKPYYISFLADPEYPLMVNLSLNYKLSLLNMQNAQPQYSEFEPGPNCVLQYKMVEAGVNEYEIKLRNTFWSDTLLRFAMSGAYHSESYSYNFDYDLVFKGKAVVSPEFLLPVFSAIKGEKLDDTNNWLFLNKSEIDKLEMIRTGDLSVPHYADDPRDYPEDYEDTAEFNAALRDFENSGRTEFTHERLGRLTRVEYMYFDNDWQDFLSLGAHRFVNTDQGMELIVLNGTKHALLAYFNDGQMYEIFLEAAGRGE